MFRDCYFEYAGISSQPYGLIIAYVENSNENFDSGGRFELKTDTLPCSHETLLYGKDYSAEPLSFDVEIVNHEDYIPLEQMAEIKNWLFGQNGWKTLKLTDERQNRCLKCIFEPGEDIVDGMGYRGIRCKLVNVSPFWYGDEREIVINKSEFTSTLYNGYYWSAFEVDIKDDDSVAIDILPTITANINKTSNQLSEVNKVILYTVDSESVAEAISTHTIQDSNSERQIWDCNNITNVTFDIGFVGEKGNENSYDTIDINTKYLTIMSLRHPSEEILIEIDTQNPLKSFRLQRGKNFCRLRYGYMYDSIAFRYTPVYRMGAF